MSELSGSGSSSGDLGDGGLNPGQVALGLVTGIAGRNHPADRFALVVDANGVDISRVLTGGPRLPLPDLTAGEQMSVASTSDDDWAEGPGVQQIHVHYLDVNGLEQVEIVTLDGTTPVLLNAPDVTFVNSMHATSVGANGGAIGVIEIFRTADDTRVYNMIDVGTNISLTSAYRVPSNKRLVLTGWQASVSGTAVGMRAVVRLRSNAQDGIVYEGVASQYPVYFTIDSMNLEAASGRSNWGAYEVLPPSTIIKATAWTTVAGAYVSASWCGYLIDV